MIPITQIYIADDNPDVLLLIEDTFSTIHQQFKLNLASNGIDLLKMIKEHNPEYPALIISDLNMPKKTGVEVLCEVRNDNKFDQTPFLVLTENTNERDTEWLHGLGANYVFSKPENHKGYLNLANKIHKYWLLSEVREMRSIFTENFKPKSIGNHSKNNFLIVDDSILHRLLLEKMLKQVKPQSIHYSYDGARAVNRFKELIDNDTQNIIILLTQELPVLDGHKAAELMRKYETKLKGKSKSYIILDSVTQFDNSGTKYFNDQIKRPYEINDLLTKIELANGQFK